MKRSKFSLSHYRLLTAEMGKLIPIACFDVLPGDTIQQATSCLVRVTPLVAPVMHPVQVRIHHWFVPNRLVWDEWEDFITGGPDGMNASSHPSVSLAGQVIGGLADYFGHPPPPPTLNVNALPFRAYNLIWNEHYRDQDLQPELAISKASGVDATTVMDLQNVAWEKDYFTSARPWTQKGPNVSLPLGVSAPVVPATPAVAPRFTVGGTNSPLQRGASTTNAIWNAAGAAGDAFWQAGQPTGLVTDLTSATATNINAVRRAFALQRYEEARARYGSRYTEYLRYLGVHSSDARLQRPEYLGGGKQTIQFSEVLQTGPTTGGDPAGVGNLSGHGIGAMRSNRYRRFFEEHGWVISLLSVKPKTMYVQGQHRAWARAVKEDYFQKELQHIGQQAILHKELYVNHSDRNGTFGYQDRYDEYRRAESGISGEFRTTLDHWHYARIFAADTALNASFVAADPTKRVYQEQTAHPLWIMTNHSIQARRMVAASGTSHIF